MYNNGLYNNKQLLLRFVYLYIIIKNISNRESNKMIKNY